MYDVFMCIAYMYIVLCLHLCAYSVYMVSLCALFFNIGISLLLDTSTSMPLSPKNWVGLSLETINHIYFRPAWFLFEMKCSILNRKLQLVPRAFCIFSFFPYKMVETSKC